MEAIATALESIGNWWSLFINNINKIFSSIVSFFSSAGEVIYNVFGFIWSVLEFIGYGIVTGLSYMWSIVDHLFSLSFWYDLFLVFKDLGVFLGVDTFYLAFMFFVAFLFIVFTFLSRLIFGKLNFVRKEKD